AHIYLSVPFISCLFVILSSLICFFVFFFNDPATSEIYTLSLHDALPICTDVGFGMNPSARPGSLASGTDTNTTPGDPTVGGSTRSEEHTSELQSRENLVCRLLLEKKKKKKNK